MLSFIESIHYQQSKMPLLHGHQQRFVRTQIANFGRLIYPELQDFISAVDAPKDEKKYKCRVLYSRDKLAVQFIPYQPRVIHKLLLRKADHIVYPYKSADRSALNKLTADLKPNEEILIVRNGYLTDSSFSNLAFLKEGRWYTPDTPLLLGVRRKSLLDAGILKSIPIHINDLRQFTKIRLVNAMMPWDQTWELPVSVIACNQIP